jgi:hypothetical protein
VFEKGQSYVALSRAATMEGLQVLRFDPKKVGAVPAVLRVAFFPPSSPVPDGGFQPTFTIEAIADTLVVIVYRSVRTPKSSNGTNR